MNRDKNTKAVIALFFLFAFALQCNKTRGDKVMTDKMKKYETIGYCGIDCGLCPRYHTKGDSVCPGCGGLYFKEKQR